MVLQAHKPKTMKTIALLFCFSLLLKSDFLPNADLYQVFYVSQGKITVKGKPAFVGQTFNSEAEVQFSNCQTEKLIAKNLQDSQLFLMVGKYDNTRDEIRIKSVFVKKLKLENAKDLIPPNSIPDSIWKKFIKDTIEFKKIKENPNVDIKHN